MKPEVQTITPERAKELLATNTSNRRINKAQVSFLAREITMGRFRENGESIKICGSRLIDGQHRLSAIIMANRPITTLVVSGLDEDAFTTIDQQKKRSGRDVLTVTGEEHASELASAIRTVIDLRSPGRWKRSSGLLPNAIYAEFIEQEPAIRESVAKAMKWKSLAKMLGRAIPAATHYLFSLTGAKRADEFFRQLETGTGLEYGSPVYVLRERLVNNMSGAARLERSSLLAYTIKAWNAYCEGSTIKMLRWGKDEEFPAIHGAK